MKKVAYFVGTVFIVFTNTHFLSAHINDYKVVETIKVGGSGNWDYLAVNNNHLYVAHGNQVEVINENNGKSIATILGTTGVHGIAFVPKLNKGFISDGKIDSVTVFNLSTNKVVAQIATGKNPDAIMYDDFSKKIIVCNGHSGSLSIIDPITEKVVATIDLDGKPEEAVSDNKGKIFVNIENKSKIAEVDILNYTLLQSWSVSPGESPSGLAYDRATNRLFAGCDNNLLVVMDAIIGKVVKTLPIGSGCDGVVFDNVRKQIFSSNGDGTLTIIKEVNKDKFAVTQNLNTKKGARTIALDSEKHILFLPTADFEPLKKNERRPKSIPGTFQILKIKR